MTSPTCAICGQPIRIGDEVLPNVDGQFIAHAGCLRRQEGAAAAERAFICPRAQSPDHPCVVHDGHLAVDDEGFCVFCGISPADELKKVAALYVGVEETMKGRP